MDIGHGAAVFMIILLCRWNLLTSTADCLFISLRCVQCAIFSAADDCFGAIYHEMAAVSLYP